MNPYNLQIPQQQQGFINRAKSPTNRSKSPPSMHSPPMSPVSRMPVSPKSPRQRQSNILMNINLNNSNTNTSINNNVNSNVGGFQKMTNLPLQVCTINFFEELKTLSIYLLIKRINSNCVFIRRNYFFKVYLHIFTSFLVLE